MGNSFFSLASSSLHQLEPLLDFPFSSSSSHHTLIIIAVKHLAHQKSSIIINPLQCKGRSKEIAHVAQQMNASR
jgi:hypothetical protein